MKTTTAKTKPPLPHKPLKAAFRRAIVDSGTEIDAGGLALIAAALLDMLSDVACAACEINDQRFLRETQWLLRTMSDGMETLIDRRETLQ